MADHQIIKSISQTLMDLSSQWGRQHERGSHKHVVIIQESLELIPGVSLSATLCPYSQLLKAAYVAREGSSAAGHKQLLCRAIMAAQFQDHGVLLRLQNSQLCTELHAQFAAVLTKLSKLSSVVRLMHVDRNNLA